MDIYKKRDSEWVLVYAFTAKFTMLDHFQNFVSARVSARVFASGVTSVFGDHHSTSCQ